MSTEVCPVIEGNLLLFEAKVKADQASMTKATCQSHSEEPKKQ